LSSKIIRIAQQNNLNCAAKQIRLRAKMNQTAKHNLRSGSAERAPHQPKNILPAKLFLLAGSRKSEEKLLHETYFCKKLRRNE
jgi:hypothetical protein